MGERNPETHRNRDMLLLVLGIATTSNCDYFVFDNTTFPLNLTGIDVFNVQRIGGDPYYTVSLCGGLFPTTNDPCAAYRISSNQTLNGCLGMRANYSATYNNHTATLTIDYDAGEDYPGFIVRVICAPTFKVDPEIQIGPPGETEKPLFTLYSPVTCKEGSCGIFQFINSRYKYSFQTNFSDVCEDQYVYHSGNLFVFNFCRAVTPQNLQSLCPRTPINRACAGIYIPFTSDPSCYCLGSFDNITATTREYQRRGTRYQNHAAPNVYNAISVVYGSGDNPFGQPFSLEFVIQECPRHPHKPNFPTNSHPNRLDIDIGDYHVLAFYGTHHLVTHSQVKFCYRTKPPKKEYGTAGRGEK